MFNIRLQIPVIINVVTVPMAFWKTLYFGFLDYDMCTVYQTKQTRYTVCLVHSKPLLLLFYICLYCFVVYESLFWVSKIVKIPTRKSEVGNRRRAEHTMAKRNKIKEQTITYNNTTQKTKKVSTTNATKKKNRRWTQISSNH